MNTKIVQLNAKYFNNVKIVPELGIIHHTATFGNCAQFLAAPPANSHKPSVHFMIHSDGVVYVYSNLIKLSGVEVPWAKQAYHAGDSYFCWGGKCRDSISKYSIGIELTGDGTKREYPECQMMSLYEIVIRIARAFPALDNPDRWVGHQHITPPYTKGRPSAPKELYEHPAKYIIENNQKYCKLPTRKPDPGPKFNWADFYKYVFDYKLG